MASYGERRRHHRVGKKSAEQTAQSAYHIKKRDKNKYIACAAALAIVIFVKGVLIGMLITKE